MAGPELPPTEPIPQTKPECHAMRPADSPTDRDPDDAETARIRAELQAFRQGFRTLLLATCAADGTPDASYAPYLDWEGDFLVLVSTLATHTRNLLDTGRASVLFIENEADARQLFARRRLTIRCDVAVVPPGTADAQRMLARFEAAFGALIATLRGLNDFHLLRLRPLHARYVTGFGKAFEVDDLALAQVRHLRGPGNRSGAAADN